MNESKVAEQLWTTGAGHFIAAQALAEIEGDRAFNGRMSASIWLLVGNAMELTLKAAFVQLGGDSGELIDIGHRLKRALKRAEDLGFTPRPPHLTWHVDVLHDAHSSHYFRYLPGRDIHLPGVERVLSVLDDLVRQVGEMIFPDMAVAAALARGDLRD